METKPRDQKQEREGFCNKKEVLEIKIFTIPLMYLRLFFSAKTSVKVNYSVNRKAS